MTAVKIRNDIEKANEQYHLRLLFYIKNRRINGQNDGFYGHVLDIDSQVCVYVSAENQRVSPYYSKYGLYRVAGTPKDYSSNGIKNGHNRYSELKTLGRDVVRLIVSEAERRKEEEKTNV